MLYHKRQMLPIGTAFYKALYLVMGIGSNKVQKSDVEGIGSQGL